MSSSALIISAAERVHEREVAVSAVARPEQVAHQAFEPLVAEALVEVAEEALLLPGPDVEELVVRAGLLEQRVVLLLRRGRRVVEHDHAHGVPVAPEVLVVLLRRSHRRRASDRSGSRRERRRAHCLLFRVALKPWASAAPRTSPRAARRARPRGPRGSPRARREGGEDTRMCDPWRETARRTKSRNS